MKKSFITALFLVFILSSYSQIAPNTYIITFKDKKNNKYSIEKPEEFLSQKALKRRQIYNIPVSEQDLPVSSMYVDSLKSLGFKIKNVSKWLNIAVVYIEDTAFIKKTEKLSFVIPNKEYKTKKEIKSTKSIGKKDENKPENLVQNVSDILKSKNQNTFSEFVFEYGNSKNQVEMLNCNYLHANNYLGQGMTIAVLDAGFYNVDKLPAFDSIRVNNQILGVRDFVAKDPDVYRDDSHGMMVLSTIAGFIPGQLVGTAPKAQFYLLRTEDESSEYLIEEYNWVCGAEYADSLGVDMIHSSLGYSNFDDGVNSHTYKDMNGDVAPVTIGADIASAKGILVVTSAGNEGNDPWKYISAPADGDSVLCVGAVDGNRNLSYFSSRGPSNDGRIKPDVMAKGSYSTVQGRNGQVTYSFGTSFSGPIMAGAVACLWQANPGFSNMEIIDAIKKSCDRYDKPDNEYGYGIPDMQKADKYLKELKSKK